MVVYESLRVKILLTFSAALAVLLFVAGGILSLLSRGGSPAGKQDGRLYPCPESPNCVCSEYPHKDAFVEPLHFVGDADTAWARAQKTVLDMGGEISRVDSGYLAATFQTPLFRFVDDVELRLDAPAKAIHIRSASRVGHSDFGTNRKRVESLRNRFNAQK